MTRLPGQRGRHLGPRVAHREDVGALGQVAAGAEVGQHHGLVGRAQDVGGLGHEVDAEEDDQLGLGGRGAAPGEQERVARDVGERDHLVALVVVPQDHGARAERAPGRPGALPELLVGADVVSVAGSAQAGAMAVVVMRPPWRGPGSAGRRGRWSGASRRPRRCAGPGGGRAAGWSRRKWAPRLSVRRSAAAAAEPGDEQQVVGLGVGAVGDGRASALGRVREARRRRARRPRRRHMASCMRGAHRRGRRRPRAAGEPRAPTGPSGQSSGSPAQRLARAGGQHRGLQQPVGGEPVGPVRAGGRALADGEEAGEGGAPRHVGQRAADGVVRGRGHRDRVARQVEAVLGAERGDGGEAPPHRRRRRGGVRSSVTSRPESRRRGGRSRGPPRRAGRARPSGARRA